MEEIKIDVVEEEKVEEISAENNEEKAENTEPVVEKGKPSKAMTITLIVLLALVVILAVVVIILNALQVNSDGGGACGDSCSGIHYLKLFFGQFF